MEFGRSINVLSMKWKKCYVKNQYEANSEQRMRKKNEKRNGKTKLTDEERIQDFVFFLTALEVVMFILQSTFKICLHFVLPLQYTIHCAMMLLTADCLCCVCSF